jgi:hypothetical protein
VGRINRDQIGLARGSFHIEVAFSALIHRLAIEEVEHPTRAPNPFGTVLCLDF